MDRVCISAGHGMGSRKPGQFDPGATAAGKQEAVGTLGMAKRLHADLGVLGIWCLLRDNGAYYEADDDAAKAGCELFMEIHFNAGTPAADGTETLIAEGADPRSLAFAKAVQSRLVRALGTDDRGVKRRGDLAVLKKHKGMASILVETHFITSALDRNLWARNVDRAELAMLNGILVTLGRKEAKSLPRKWGAVRRALHYVAGRIK